MIIAASIISSNFLNLAQDLFDTQSAGVDWLHIDVMDGKFVPNITIGPFILPICRKAVELPLDVHLMIEEPEKHIKTFALAGADRISVHVENNPNILRTIQEIRELGVKPGIVLNPGTPVSAIENILPFVDMVLVMSVNPGFSGQKFIPHMVEKISLLKSILLQKNLDTLIEVDGGINKETISQVIKAGADVVVTATAIYNHPNGIIEGVNELRNSI
jgi:ribulose-phosphate 3-epimerase